MTIVRRLLIIAWCVLLIGCGGVSTPNIDLTISPPTCTIPSGKEYPVSVTGNFPTGSTIEWSASQGNFKNPNVALTHYIPPHVTTDTSVIIYVKVISPGNTGSSQISCTILAEVPTPSVVSTALPITITIGPSAIPTFEPAAPTAPTDVSPATAPVFGTTLQQAYEAIRAQGKITVGVSYNTPPYGEDKSWSQEKCQATISDTAFNPVGFDVDLARHFALRWLGDPNAVEFRCVTTQDRVPYVKDRKVMIGLFNLSNVADRCVQVDCSNRYMEDTLGILTRIESGINAPCDLNGKKVAVVEKTSAIYLFESYVKTFCDFTSPPQIVVAKNREEAIGWLDSGQVDGYSTSSRILDSYANAGRVVSIRSIAPENIVAAVPKGETGLRQLINTTIQAMKSDGSYDALYETSFGCESKATDIPPGIEPIPDFLKIATPTQPTCDNQPAAVYIVKPGDTLGGLARRFYGSFDLWPCIKKANRDLDERRLSIDQELEIPTLQACRDSMK